MLVSARIIKLDKSVKTALRGPIVAAAYYVVAYIIRYISCLPTYTDAEFADIPVAQYLLLALAVAAAILTVFAMLSGLRLYRQSARARSAERKAGRWGLAGIVLGAVALGAIVLGAPILLEVDCV
ncbi:MAG: hypothetical protein ACLGHO_08900 [Gammaproteobacteria bacterium]